MPHTSYSSLPLIAFLTILPAAALAQDAAQPSPEQKEQKKVQRPEPAQRSEAERSGTTIQPGRPALKTTEIERKPISPWKRFPRNVLNDQKHIWTSPFRMNRESAPWWAGFGAGTAVLIATDKWTSRQLPNTRDQIAVARWTSRLGAAYTLAPITAGFYFVGTFSKNERFRETGLIGFETLANTFLVNNALKMTTQRQRPLEGQGEGRFFQGTGRIWNAGASFPSGHAINSWALASVIAHEYPHPRIIPITAYSVATVVVGSRFAVRKHFASDVVVGAAMGWFIGDFVFHRRHNPNVEPTQHSGVRRILAHVRFGP